MKISWTCRTFISLLLVGFFVESARSESWAFDHVSEISLYSSYVKNPELLGADSVDQGDAYLFANTKLTATRGKSSLEFEPELRSLDGTRDLPAPFRTDIQPPNRLMSLNSTIVSSNRNETVLDVERLNANYRTDSTEISLGRKPVSLGVLTVFPVWNKFTRPLITGFGPLRVFSQDQASVRFQSGAWMFQGLDIEERTSERATRIGQVSWYGDGIELHILGGEWWDSDAVGFAGVKDLAGVSFRFEEISFSGDGAQVGLGAERALSEHWTLLAEYLYLENGDSSTAQYLTVPVSQFRPLLAKNYGFPRIEYKPGQLWDFQVGALMNFLDDSMLWNPKVTYSLANDSDVNLEVRLPTGGDNSELSRKLLPTQMLVGLRTVF